MLRNNSLKQNDLPINKKHKVQTPELTPYAQKQPNPSIFYPFGPESSPYPCNYAYQYAPPPPLGNYYMHPYMPSYPYPAFAYPPALPAETKRPDKKIKKEVIDLESPAMVKTEPIEEIKPYSYIRQVLDIEPRHPPRPQGMAKVSEEYFTDKYSIKTNNLQKIFKTMVIDFVGQKPNPEAAKLQLMKSLKYQGEWKTNKAFCDNLFTAVSAKFQSFKKTKEEIIKYIIRRTYHNAKHQMTTITKVDFQKLESFHDRNLNLHKSMNTDFLKKEFANKTFVTIYKEFIHQMDEQFDKENDERVTRFSITLASAWIEKSVTMIQYEKKLPWIHSYKLKIRKIALQLLHSFEECANTPNRE